ncbi:hypothetical protein ASF61_16830 [Duganella sp. Leaf126]|uniref:terminase small subunit n=1 Tax=Duganella sp. Leaf126 TaxID=1736266 RepID=UPI0007002807|nr:terminase small subunit [Duganella sp. Leaf126]KQQ31998.1 hypothetical protein ASF61_16830 [Duganella sp. Leaf126]
MELTGKHRLFADAVLAGMSNKDAAIAAGYSEKTAGPAGSRLAKNSNVAAFIKKYKKVGAPTPPPPPAPAPRATFDVKQAITFSDPLDFLRAAMNDPAASDKLRVEAAKALAPFVHARKGESSKRDEAKDRAKTAASGKYVARQGPKLVSSR